MDEIHKIKIGIVGEQKNYANWVLLPYEVVTLTKIPKNKELESIDLLIFTGGEDVSPSFYNETPHYTTHSNMDRDMFERTIFNMAFEFRIPMIGICRGSQFLTVMSGGKLVQNVENHAIGGTHPLFIPNQTIPLAEITSTHHQMMYPFNTLHVLLCVSKKRSSFYNMNERVTLKNFMIDEEPEIVFYPETAVLAIQGHPEYMEHDTLIVKLLNWYLSYLFKLNYELDSFDEPLNSQIQYFKTELQNNVYRRYLKSFKPVVKEPRYGVTSKVIFYDIRGEKIEIENNVAQGVDADIEIEPPF